MKYAENYETGLTCPNCGPSVKLIVKANTKTGSQFLGCPNYPECRHTREIPEEWKMREAGQMEMFSLEQVK